MMKARSKKERTKTAVVLENPHLIPLICEYLSDDAILSFMQVRNSIYYSALNFLYKGQ